MTVANDLDIQHFFDDTTCTLSYVVLDRASGACVVIDSVLGYDPKSGRTTRHGADRIIDHVRSHHAQVHWILETHVHADHLSAAPYLKSVLGGRTGIGVHIRVVQDVFGALFNAGPSFARDGRQFDTLFADGEILRAGALEFQVWHTPGHTPACVIYVLRLTGQASTPAAAFVGDTLFMPDYGTARCDFPGGNARVLYRSIHRVLDLPGTTPLYMCHDYQPGGRALQWMTTVAAQRQHNIHVRDGISEDAFVAMRTARDATLAMPTLILPSVQVNMRAGELPAPESNGIRYLKIPVDAL